MNGDLILWSRKKGEREGRLMAAKADNLLRENGKFSESFTKKVTKAEARSEEGTKKRHELPGEGINSQN